jgi:hypothetical protein
VYNLELETVVNNLNSKYNFDNLIFLHESVNEFVFASDNAGHITVSKDTYEITTTRYGITGYVTEVI